jgi:uncharacterized membrane protein
MPFLYHPLVVHFPVALWLVSFLFDVGFVATRDRFYALASRFLIGLGLLAAPVVIIAGFVDYIPLVNQGVGAAFVAAHRVHSALAYASTVIYAALFFARLRGRGMATGPYLAGALLGAAVIAVTSYLGGEIRRVM